MGEPKNTKKKRSKWMKYSIGLVVLLVVVSGSIGFYMHYMVKGSNDYFRSTAISRSTAVYTFCLCLARCLYLLILVTINIPSKGFLSFTAKSSSPILLPIRCQVLPSGVLDFSGFPGA